MPKVALVTGSSDLEGIGYATAKALLRTGCDVILTGSREAEKVVPLQEEIYREFKIRPDYIRADLRNIEDIERLCSECKRLYPDGIDILVNNAGFSEVFPIESYPTDKFNDIIAVVLSAPFHLIRLILPDMKGKEWGRIINISSVSGERAISYMSAYCAAKHGLNGLTKAVAKETAEFGVTCNSIMPGVVKTGLTMKGMAYLAEIEGVSAEEMGIGDLVVFLCSSSAAQMTGCCIPIDGGNMLNTCSSGNSRL
uniref:3-oxoacyl-[acyl-carrier-protein] reductase n=1 Tax=Saccoglossus kowalevskii TaxID=10224 RepID=A0ABM0GIB8_SACKO|nr:PREDICTED: tropinone reductase 2-like [Saccoglossus kowalevskii]